MTKRVRIAGTASGLGLAALVALPVAAQEDGGVRLTFGILTRVESVSNPGLTIPSDPALDKLAVRLSFGLTDTTRASAVSLRVAGSLAKDNDDDTTDGLVEPDLRLGWARSGATSSLDLSAFLRETDLDTLRGFVLDPETGQITDDVTGNGVQRQTGGDVTYSFGEGGPWGGSLFGGVIDTTYSGTTTEADTRRSDVGGTLRLNLDAATEVTAGLSWSRYDQEGEAIRDTRRSEVGVRRNLPAGVALADIFVEDTEDGVRRGLSFGRSWDMPDSTLAFSLGVTRDVTGELSPTGSLNWQKDLPRGSLSAVLRQEVTSDSEDLEAIVTTVSLGLSHSISPLSSVRFGLNASDNEETQTNNTTTNAALSAIYTHTLPYDWALDAGVTHRIRNEDDSGEATSDTIFLELRRAFEWRH